MSHFIMASYFDDLFDDDILPPAAPSASAESYESQVTTETTDTAELSESSDTDAPASSKQNTRKSYSKKRKLEILDYAKKHNSDNMASRFFKVGIQSIRRWR